MDETATLSYGNWPKLQNMKEVSSASVCSTPGYSNFCKRWDFHYILVFQGSLRVQGCPWCLSSLSVRCSDQGTSVHLMRFCFWGFAQRVMTRWAHKSFQTMANHAAFKQRNTLEISLVGAPLFDIWKFGLSRAFIIKDKFSCDGKESCPLETLPGNCILCSWDMFLTHCTTTFQLCIMQLLLALMSYKAHILILFLETGCPGMHSFGLVWGVRWSRGALCTLDLCWISGSKARQGSGLQLWISKVKKKKKKSCLWGQIWILVRNNVSQMLVSLISSLI